MNRRRFAACVATGALCLSASRVLAKPEPEVTPVVVGTLAATPSATTAPYDGPIADLWDKPWRTEGKTVTLNGVIVSKTIAPEGRGLRVGADDLPYRSLIVLQIPNAPDRGQVLIASNDDLSRFRSLHTAQVIGVYAGKQNLYENGGYWSAPLLVAVSIGEVPTTSR